MKTLTVKTKRILFLSPNKESSGFVEFAVSDAVPADEIKGL